MSSYVIRIIPLLFVFATVLKGFYNFVTSMYALSYPPPYDHSIQVRTVRVTTERACGRPEHVPRKRRNLNNTFTSNSSCDISGSSNEAIVPANIYSAEELLIDVYDDVARKKPAKKYPQINKGGWYKPQNGTAVQTVAVIVPYRDRQKQLEVFLRFMHPYLINQNIEYGIFVIEQQGTLPFNRGKLLNVGFMESQKMGFWPCFIFHDVDLLPIDTRIRYRCGKQPRHMSGAVTTQYKVPFNHIFGGVTSIPLEQFKHANGYSNKYWGWGGGDDDMYRRLLKLGYRITRYNATIARYAMLNHTERRRNIKRWRILSNTIKDIKNDGLSSLKYEVMSVTWGPLSTHIVANIDKNVVVRRTVLDGEPYEPLYQYNTDP